MNTHKQPRVKDSHIFITVTTTTGNHPKRQPEKAAERHREEDDSARAAGVSHGRAGKSCLFLMLV